MYSCTLSLTAAIDEVGGQRHSWSALLPGKTRYPVYRRLGGPQGRSGRVRKISPSPGFGPRTFQPIASRCTEYAIPAHQRPCYPLQCLVRRVSTLLLASCSLTCVLSLVYVRITSSGYYHCFCIVLSVFRLPLFFYRSLFTSFCALYLHTVIIALTLYQYILFYIVFCFVILFFLCLCWLSLWVAHFLWFIFFFFLYLSCVFFFVAIWLLISHICVAVSRRHFCDCPLPISICRKLYLLVAVSCLVLRPLLML